jgi:hypothetical protein
MFGKLIDLKDFVRNLTLCPEFLQTGSRALHVTDEPMTVSPVSSTPLFAAPANLLAILTVSYIQIDVM